MYELKTRETDVEVEAFLDSVPNPQRREDAKRVCAMMARISGYPPKMWGPSIVGFGRYRYTYDSGHSGEMCRTGFSPRKSELVLYVIAGFERYRALMDRLGRHRTGKSCLYIRKLSDVDEEVLEQLIAEGLAYINEQYPEGA